MRVVALTFHDVANGSDGASKSDSFYRISKAEFEQLVSSLRRLGYQTASSRQFRAWQAGGGQLPERRPSGPSGVPEPARFRPERSVVLTFDDGYASHFELVAPLLVRYRFSGTFFISADLVGRPGYMSWDQLRKLAFLGMEIGSHGLSHTPLTQLSPSELARELVTSKRRLEDELGLPVRALAAPGGCWNQAVAEAVTQAGYEAAWVSTIGTNGPDTNPLALRRVVVRQPFSAERIVSMVEGWEPAFWWAANQQAAIRGLKRMLGVYRYEQLKRRLVPNA